MSPLSNYQSLRVVVIGSYNTDLVIWCDAIPVKGQSILGGDFEMFSGGRGANCAVAAARSGCKVKFVGAHGPDAFGNMARDRLAREGIDITDFVELPSSKTGIALIFQERKTAFHSALVSNSANTDFSPTLVKKVESDIRESDLVFTQFEISTAALLEVYRICHHHKNTWWCTQHRFNLRSPFRRVLIIYWWQTTLMPFCWPVATTWTPPYVGCTNGGCKT